MSGHLIGLIPINQQGGKISSHKFITNFEDSITTQTLGKQWILTTAHFLDDIGSFLRRSSNFLPKQNFFRYELTNFGKRFFISGGLTNGHL